MVLSEAIQNKLSDAESKSPDYLTIPNIRALDRKQKSDNFFPRGANPGEIRKRDFKRGDRRAAGVTLVLTYVVEMLNIPNQPLEIFCFLLPTKYNTRERK